MKRLKLLGLGSVPDLHKRWSRIAVLHADGRACCHEATRSAVQRPRVTQLWFGLAVRAAVCAMRLGYSKPSTLTPGPHGPSYAAGSYRAAAGRPHGRERPVQMTTSSPSKCPQNMRPGDHERRLSCGRMQGWLCSLALSLAMPSRWWPRRLRTPALSLSTAPANAARAR